MNMISEEMFDTMMHMIGYGHLEGNFIDAMQSCDYETLLELAGWCDHKWGTNIVGRLNKNKEE
tara:strand:+ start:1356 stop:1544 length:189 start_codon:yes stop_codon:yes gene_type:complete